MPSGLEKGPENSKRTRRDGTVRRSRIGRAAGSAASAASAPSGGSPGGWDESPSQGCATASLFFSVSTLKKSMSCNTTCYKKDTCNTKWHRVASFGARAKAMTNIGSKLK
eukprot:745541-Pleurochrysis_carterae.AAC.1